VSLQPDREFNKAWIKRWIITNRDTYNLNNCTRTNFYLKYWDRNREVPWVLIAHIVSRNAGYQMSDLIRLRLFIQQKGILGKFTTGLEAESSVDHLFAFLEAGNYLIFYDVFPQLVAYEWAKHFYIHTGQDFSPALFGMLTEDDFGVDPFILEEWKSFFAEARKDSWLHGDAIAALKGAAVRQTLALIANEQNYIEERLVNPGISGIRYLNGHQHSVVHRFIKRTNRQGFPKVTVVVADPKDTSMPDSLIFCPARYFTELDGRIDIGRELFACIFRQDETRSNLIQAWVSAEQNRTHHGTRADYDRYCYSADSSNAKSNAQIYSPPLVSYGNHLPAWPIDPGKDKRFYQTHGKPARLPSWSQKTSKRKIELWLDCNTGCNAEASLVDPYRTPVEILI